MNAGLLQRIRQKRRTDQQIGKAGRFGDRKRFVQHGKAHIHLDEQNAFGRFRNGVGQIDGRGRLALALYGACNAENAAAILIFRKAEHHVCSKQLIGLRRREAELAANHCAAAAGILGVSMCILVQVVFSFLAGS